MKELFTLDRIEEKTVAVLLDSEEYSRSVPLSLLTGGGEIGGVYSFADGKYIYEKEETQKRRERIIQRKNSLFARLENTD